MSLEQPGEQPQQPPQSTSDNAKAAIGDESLRESRSAIVLMPNSSSPSAASGAGDEALSALIPATKAATDASLDNAMLRRLLMLLPAMLRHAAPQLTEGIGRRGRGRL